MSTVCKTCGGPVNRVGNYYVCEYCRNKWEIDSGDDIHAVDRANAWAALRDGDFEKAAELFENIIVKEAKNHEAYWGRALALAGIVYVTDMNENKKVPTCNNITEESFINNKDVKKAISLAPADIADGYKQQAEYIEKVRVEWLEKASKEPEYDVFISFKDSDRENGIERTQDSIDAQDLYNALVAEGYKVFFSRISLRDKIAEQYEPYIYNAIKTAKVMIVFGEKAEYFSSVWIKNEWSRFKTRIEKGEKHKNSLVVVYKNMNPGDLPVVLKSRQCLNAGDMTFLPDLYRHIKRVVDESKKNVHLDKIEIAGGQIAKKATALTVNSVQTREIGAGAIAETSISEKQQIELVKSYINSKQWDDADKLLDDILFNNPALPDAIYGKLLVKNTVATTKALVSKIRNFSDEDYGLLEKYLNIASKDNAATLLNWLYDSGESQSEEVYLSLLKVILPYNYSSRNERISKAFDSSIQRDHINIFKLLITTLGESEVDKYINYHLKFARKTKSTKHKIYCIDSILSVDAGNIDALKLQLQIHLATESNKTLICDFEEILKYSKYTDNEVMQTLKNLSESLSNEEQCLFAKQVLKYYKADLAKIKDLLISLSNRMISQAYFEHAQYLLGLVLSVDANSVEAYWGLCLIKTKSTSEKEIINSKISTKSIPEYTKYLTMVNEARRQECIELSKKQISHRKAKKVMLILASLVSIVIVFVITYNSYIEPNQRYEQAIALMNDGEYSDAEDMFEELGSFKDSSVKIQDIHNIKAYNYGVDFAKDGSFETALKYFREIPNYKDSANYITYCEAILNANEIFDAEAKLKSLPSNFLKTKELLTFIENNKKYSGKKYQATKEVASWNNPYITLKFKLVVEDENYKVNFYHVDDRYSHSTLSLDMVVGGKYTTSANGSDAYIVIEENILTVYNYFHDGTRTYKIVN